MLSSVSDKYIEYVFFDVHYIGLKLIIYLSISSSIFACYIGRYMDYLSKCELKCEKENTGFLVNKKTKSL